MFFFYWSPWRFQGNRCDKRVKVIVTMCGDAVVKNQRVWRWWTGCLEVVLLVCLFDYFLCSEPKKKWETKRWRSWTNWVPWSCVFFWGGGGNLNGFIVDAYRSVVMEKVCRFWKLRPFGPLKWFMKRSFRLLKSRKTPSTSFKQLLIAVLSISSPKVNLKIGKVSQTKTERRVSLAVN